jgi:sulfatase maturation enzyme AslB (radical SAM superfamily)
VLLALRDRSRLRGKCRICEYREVCGGSRSRAYAVTGDYLESDPYCPHQPDPAAGYRQVRSDARDRRAAVAASR